MPNTYKTKTKRKNNTKKWNKGGSRFFMSLFTSNKPTIPIPKKREKKDYISISNNYYNQLPYLTKILDESINYEELQQIQNRKEDIIKNFEEIQLRLDIINNRRIELKKSKKPLNEEEQTELEKLKEICIQYLKYMKKAGFTLEDIFYYKIIKKGHIKWSELKEAGYSEETIKSHNIPLEKEEEEEEEKEYQRQKRKEKQNYRDHMEFDKNYRYVSDQGMYGNYSRYEKRSNV